VSRDSRGTQPTATAKAKRDALLRELRTGRKILCYEMVSHMRYS
jgi:hypothetical protein